MNHMDPPLHRQSSPAKAGDLVLQRQQALTRAKALVWASSNGVREECAPDSDIRTPAIHDDPVGQMAEATQ
jgi:hypothetical protein